MPLVMLIYIYSKHFSFVNPLTSSTVLLYDFFSLPLPMAFPGYLIIGRQTEAMTNGARVTAPDYGLYDLICLFPFPYSSPVRS